MGNQPIFVTAKIEDDPIVAHEIDCVAELPLDLARIYPTCIGHEREPSADRALSLRVTRQNSFSVQRAITCMLGS